MNWDNCKNATLITKVMKFESTRYLGKIESDVRSRLVSMAMKHPDYALIQQAGLLSGSLSITSVRMLALGLWLYDDLHIYITRTRKELHAIGQVAGKGTETADRVFVARMYQRACHLEGLLRRQAKKDTLS